MSCGCGGMCGCEDTLQGYPFGLGFIGLDANAQASIAASGQSGRITEPGDPSIYTPGTVDCAASGISAAARDVGLVGSGAGLALTGAVQTGMMAAGPATFGITIAIASIVGIFSTIFNHHAQAVKKEQSVLCSAVPAANNYLNIIDQGVSEGLITPQQALQALDSLSNDFRSSVGSIYKSCNAACVMQMCLDAAIATEKAKYTSITQQASSPAATPARPNTVAASGSGGSAAAGSSYASFYSGAMPAAPSSSALPSWWPVAAAAVLGLLLVRS